MRQSTSAPGVGLKAFPYDNFQGIDTVRDARAMDIGSGQTLTTLTNAHADDSGQIVRDPGAYHVAGQRPVTFLRYLDAETFVFSEVFESGLALNSSRDHQLLDAYAPGSPISGCVFGGEVFTAAPGQAVRAYGGALWREAGKQALRDHPPSFMTAVNRRLAVAGMARYPTQVWLSRVDDAETMPQDEDANDESVLRAGYIDIRNMINSGDIVTGIGAFEWNRLAIFTHAQALVYAISPNMNSWTIADQTSIGVGCISHNSIVKAGRDLVFCSKRGVHVIRRSRYNNFSVDSMKMSRRVDLLYRHLVERVQDKRLINAAWDEDTGRYHIYFPESDRVCWRLSVAIPQTDDEKDQPRWALGSYLDARCADSLAGSMLIGSAGGVYSAYEVGEDPRKGGPAVSMDVRTPVLWCGGMSAVKDGYSYILQASGEGRLDVEISDENGTVIQTDVIELDESDSQDKLPYEQLPFQFQRKLERRFLGLRFRFRSAGVGLVRISGLAINVKR